MNVPEIIFDSKHVIERHRFRRWSDRHVSRLKFKLNELSFHFIFNQMIHLSQLIRLDLSKFLALRLQKQDRRASW